MLALLLTFTACDTNDADAADTWEEVQGYADWAQLDGWAGVQPSCDGTHGAYVQVWYNDAGAAVAESGDQTAADGAIYVKESYEDDASTVKNITVMKKRDGYDADNGDWFWAMYDTGGGVSQAGALSGCSGCHASGVDYVRFVDSPAVATLDDCP